MEPLSIIATTLLSQCTLSCITESVFTGWLGNRSDAIITKIPKLAQRLTAQLKDTEQIIKHDLHKAILSAHWLATKVFAEQFRKTTRPIDVFQKVLSVADEQLKLIAQDTYEPVVISPEVYETDLMILKREETEAVQSLRARVVEFHIAQLKSLCGTAVNLLGFEQLRTALRHGFPNDSLDWFELVCAFLNELLKGDNNKAKDAFQNQELAKIGLEVSEIKVFLKEFENLAHHYVVNIGEDRFQEFKGFVLIQLEGIKNELEEIKTGIKLVENKVTQFGSDVLEIKQLLNKQLNLNNFPDYQNFIAVIAAFNLAFEEKQDEKQETLELLQDETDERKRKRFEKDLTTINQELLEIDEKRSQKTDELNNFKTYIEKTWLSLYGYNTQNSPRLLKARELFEKGDLADANAALDPKTLQHDYDLLNKATEIIQQKQAMLAQEFLAKANFTVLEKANKNWFAETNQYYAQALTLHESYDICFAYAYFLQVHNQVLEAAVIYEKALNYVSDEYQRAIIINNLGLLRRAKNEFGKAESSYEEALAIYRKLVLLNPQVYLADVAMTLNNLRNLQRDKDEFDKAQRNYEEALTIIRELARLNPHTYLENVAVTLNNLGNLQLAKNEFGKAESNYEEALAISKELARSNPQTYSSYVAATLNNLGNLQRDKNEFDKAKGNYEEALATYRELVKLNPQTYLVYVAGTLNNLGLLQRTNNEFDKAQCSYEEALAIRRELARLNPQTYTVYVATTLNSLGNLQRDKNEFDKAQGSYEEALTIYRELAQLNPKTFFADVAMTLNNLGNLQRDKNEFDKAENSYEEALAIRRELARLNSQAYLTDVAMTLNNLGNLQRDKNEFDKAESSYEEALAIYRELARLNPQSYLASVATMLNNLGKLQHDKNEFDKAESSYEEALAIRRELVHLNPQNYLEDVAVTLNNLGNLQLAKNEFDKAECSYEEAFEIRQALTQQNPEVYQISLAEIMVNLAIFYLYSVSDKGKSLELSLCAFMNAAPYHQQVPKALYFCQQAIQIWQEWQEDLMKYLQENQEKIINTKTESNILY